MPGTGTITKVEDRDFEYGFLNDCRFCPIAIALRRNGYHDPVVDDSGIEYYNDPYKETSKEITEELRKKIASIDNRNTTKPFSIIERDDKFSIYRRPKNAK